MPAPYRLTLTTLALAATLAVLGATPCAAQEDPAATPTQAFDGARPLLHLDDFETVFFTPRHADVSEIMYLAQQLYGRDIYVLERGGYAAAPVQNLQRLSDSILIYDEPAYGKRLMEWLAGMDRPTEEPAPVAAPLDVLHWSPGHISLGSARVALSPFNRSVEVSSVSNEPAGTRRTQLVSNITVLDDQNTLVLRETPEQLLLMTDLLAAIDQPEPQLLVTAMVVIGHHGDSPGGSVPAELAAGLSRLVPFESFRQRSMGLVRTSVRNRVIDLEMETGDRFQLRPDAFDPDSGELSARIEFKTKGGFGFETRTSLTAGEYVVLGASGSEPVFAVLRIEILNR